MWKSFVEKALFATISLQKIMTMQATMENKNPDVQFTLEAPSEVLWRQSQRGDSLREDQHFESLENGTWAVVGWTIAEKADQTHQKASRNVDSRRQRPGCTPERVGGENDDWTSRAPRNFATTPHASGPVTGHSSFQAQKARGNTTSSRPNNRTKIGTDKPCGFFTHVKNLVTQLFFASLSSGNFKHPSARFAS